MGYPILLECPNSTRGSDSYESLTSKYHLIELSFTDDDIIIVVLQVFCPVEHRLTSRWVEHIFVPIWTRGITPELEKLEFSSHVSNRDSDPIGPIERSISELSLYDDLISDTSFMEIFANMVRQSFLIFCDILFGDCHLLFYWF